jgi:hypothetical protein
MIRNVLALGVAAGAPVLAQATSTEWPRLVVPAIAGTVMGLITFSFGRNVRSFDRRLDESDERIQRLNDEAKEHRHSTADRLHAQSLQLTEALTRLSMVEGQVTRLHDVVFVPKTPTDSH